MRSTSDVVSQVCDPRYLDPQTGPFFVEGAEPGDTLVVHFRSMTSWEGRGVRPTVPLFGSLTARPLEDAFRIAHTEMAHWIEVATALSTMDAYQFVSQTAMTPNANVVDVNCTVVAKVTKRYLPGVRVMGGVHDRRRDR